MPAFPAKKLVRSAQVFFPSLDDAKFAVHHWLHTVTGRLFEPEYGCIVCFARQGALVLDIGANRRQSIVAFRNALPDCRIVIPPLRLQEGPVHRGAAGSTVCLVPHRRTRRRHTAGAEQAGHRTLKTGPARGGD
jgi:hypothetical protein